MNIESKENDQLNSAHNFLVQFKKVGGSSVERDKRIKT